MNRGARLRLKHRAYVRDQNQGFPTPRGYGKLRVADFIRKQYNAYRDLALICDEKPLIYTKWVNQP